MPYIVVALLGAVVGVVVAGLPEGDDGAPTLAISDTTFDLGGSDTTGLPSSPPSTSVLPATTGAPAPPITPEPSTAPAPETTAAPSTAPPDTTSPPPPPTTQPVDRNAVNVVVANGTLIGGVAGRTAATLRELGWGNVQTGDGTQVFGSTVVYFVDGFGDAANQVAADLGFDGVFVVPIEGAPALQGNFPGLEVLLYMGEEQA